MSTENIHGHEPLGKAERCSHRHSEVVSRLLDARVRLQQRALHPQARLCPGQGSQRSRTRITPGSLLAQVNESKRETRALSDEELRAMTPQAAPAPGQRGQARRPASRSLRRLPGGRPPHQEHAPFRRANPRRHRPAPRQYRRNGHRRRQDAGGHPAGVPQCSGRHGRPHRHGQRLPGSPRLRMDAAHLQGPGPDRRLHPERHGAGLPGAMPTIATSPTAPTANSASITCATT